MNRKIWIWAGIGSLLTVVGLADYFSRYEIVFTPFYFPIIVLAVWNTRNFKLYTTVVCFCTAVWYLDAIHNPRLGSLWIFCWNAAVVNGAYVFIMLLTIKLKAQHDLTASIKEELRRLLEHEKHLARLDPLTDALNLRALEEKIESESKRSRRYGRGFSFLYIDIDRFKEMNDMLGHEYGNGILKAMVTGIRKTTRSADVLGRLGGDEFGLLLPETGRREAVVCGRKIVDLLQKMDPPISVSIGVAATDTDAESSAIIGQADSAMYRAKRAGGSRIVTTSEY